MSEPTAEQKAQMEAQLKEMQSEFKGDDHMYDLDSLNDEQKTQLGEAKGLLGADAPIDAILLQFLVAQKFDPSATAEMYRKALAFRKEHKIDELRDNPPPVYEDLKVILPHAIGGFSKAGFPLYFEKPGRVAVNQVLEQDSEAMRHGHCYIFEQISKQMEAATERAGKPMYRVVVVMDLSGLSLYHQYALGFVRQCSEIDNLIYPERVEKVLVINSPWVMPGLWNIAKGFLNESIQRRVKVLQSVQELQNYIDLDQLPKEYGGTAHIALPEATAEQLQSVSDKVVAGRTLEEEYIAAGASFATEITLKKGDSVEWFYRVKDSYDISFKATLQGKELESTTKVIVGKGDHTATEDCTVDLEWDNSFSWLNGKYLQYEIKIQHA